MKLHYNKEFYFYYWREKKKKKLHYNKELLLFFTTPYTGEKTHETPLQQRILSFTNLVIILINY